jgi:hypothetical protein
MAAQPETRRWAWLKDWGVVVISLATLVSTSYQFYFREVLREERKPTALAIEAKLEQVGRRDDLVLVRIVVRASNPSDRRIYVPAFWYTLYGMSLSDRACAESIPWHRLQGSSDRMVIASYNTLRNTEVVAQRRMFGELAWWEPRDVTNFEDIVALPADRFDYAKLYVTYQHGRSMAGLDEARPVVWTIAQDGEWFPLMMTTGFRQALSSHRAGEGKGAQAVQDMLAGKTVQASDLPKELLGAYDKEVIRWSERTTAGANYFESGLSLASAAGDAGAVRVPGKGAALPACH